VCLCNGETPFQGLKSVTFIHYVVHKFWGKSAEKPRKTFLNNVTSHELSFAFGCDRKSITVLCTSLCPSVPISCWGTCWPKSAYKKSLLIFGYPRACRFRKHQIENRLPVLALPTFFKMWFLIYKMWLKLAKIDQKWIFFDLFKKSHFLTLFVLKLSLMCSEKTWTFGSTSASSWCVQFITNDFPRSAHKRHHRYTTRLL
jgi:hypothetical protein